MLPPSSANVVVSAYKRVVVALQMLMAAQGVSAFTPLLLTALHGLWTAAFLTTLAYFAFLACFVTVSLVRGPRTGKPSRAMINKLLPNSHRMSTFAIPAGHRRKRVHSALAVEPASVNPAWPVTHEALQMPVAVAPPSDALDRHSFGPVTVTNEI